jgi:hypothetical protein
MLASSTPVVNTTVVNKDKEKDIKNEKVTITNEKDVKQEVSTTNPEKKVDDPIKNNKQPPEQPTKSEDLQQKPKKDSNTLNTPPVITPTPIKISEDKSKDSTAVGKADNTAVKLNNYNGTSKLLTLTLENLEVKELVNKGSFVDKQDPSLQIKIGNNKFSTERLQIK